MDSSTSDFMLEVTEEPLFERYLIPFNNTLPSSGHQQVI